MAAPPISARLTCGRSEMRWNSSWNGRVTFAAASILSGAAKRVEISARSAPPENTLRLERMCSTLQSLRAARPSRMPWNVLNISALNAFTGAPAERHRGDPLRNGQADQLAHLVSSGSSE